MDGKTVWLAWWWTADDTGVNGIFSTEEKALAALGESGLKIIMPDAQLTLDQQEAITGLLAEGSTAEASRLFIHIMDTAIEENKPVPKFGMRASPYIVDEAHL